MGQQPDGSTAMAWWERKRILCGPVDMMMDM